MQLFQEIVVWLSQEPVVWITAIYLILINMLAISTMWWDKRKAEMNEWRVSEATLLIMGFIGGATGLLVGMARFCHKTRKMSFQVLVVLGLIVSFIIYWIEARAILWWLFLI